MPYLGYVETHLRIPEIKASDNDIHLLILPDSAHTHHTPITLGTLHIDMAIKLAMKKELDFLNKQEEFDSNQVDHERSTDSKSRRYMNSIKNTQYSKNR